MDDMNLFVPITKIDLGKRLSAVQCRQCRAGAHAAGLLPDRMAAARPPLRDRRLRRRSAAALFPAVHAVIANIATG
jgi:hypothetical protein